MTSRPAALMPAAWRLPFLCVALAVAAPSIRAQDAIDPNSPQADPDNSRIDYGVEAEPAINRGPAPPPDAPPGGSSGSMTVTPALCDQIATYTPDADVSAGEGDRADGAPPADDPSTSRLRLPGTIPVPITGSPPRGSGSGAMYRPWPQVGYVMFDHGRLSFNGQPLGDQDAEEVASICRSMKSGRRPTGRMPPPPTAFPPPPPPPPE